MMIDGKEQAEKFLNATDLHTVLAEIEAAFAEATRKEITSLEIIHTPIVNAVLDKLNAEWNRMARMTNYAIIINHYEHLIKENLPDVYHYWKRNKPKV